MSGLEAGMMVVVDLVIATQADASDRAIHQYSGNEIGPASHGSLRASDRDECRGPTSRLERAAGGAGMTAVVD